MENIELIISGDGSHTLRLKDMDETYHSRKGAITESDYVFIQKGLHAFKEKSHVDVLEVGFGTGLNAFLVYLDTLTSGQKVYFQTMEPFPLPADVYEQLNYTQELNQETHRDMFIKMHECAWHEEVVFTDKFSMSKVRAPLEKFVVAPAHFDVVFFDAFAPSKQEEVWSPRNMKKCYAALRKGGLLVSYCSQGQFRRDLEKAKFRVEKIDGPPGKREMVVAYKD